MKRLIPALAILLASACAALATPPVPLTSVGAIRALSKDQANLALPVAFEGTVTYYAAGFRYLFVQDQGQAIFVYAPDGIMLSPGDRVLVHGVTNAEFSPDVTSDSVTLLSHGNLPEAIPSTFDDLIGGQRDCLLVTVRGKVRAANLVLRPDVRNKITLTLRVAYLDLLTDGGYINVIINSNDESTIKDLLDTEVEVTGADGGIYDGKWHQTGIVIRAPSLSAVKVLERASTNPWSLPITPMDRLLSTYHVIDQTQRVHVRGSITYYQPGFYRPGSAIVLQNGAESLWVESLGDKPMRIGDVVDATGIPDVASGSPVLTHAELQQTGTQASIAPLDVTGAQLADAYLAGKHHNDLVSLEGQVVMAAREAGQDEYVLIHDGQLFSAILRHPDATSQLQVPAMKRIATGSTIRVTGICILQDMILFSGKAPFNILLRSSDDISVVSGPSLLSIRNLALLVGLLLIAVALAGANGWVLERKVRRQTALLSTHLEAEAELERRRSRILEDINRSQPLAEIIENIASLVSFILDDAPCWCEIANGAQLGGRPPTLEGKRIVRVEIPARSGPPLGMLKAALPEGIPPSAQRLKEEQEALAIGTGLATLAIETSHLYSDLRRRSEFDLLTDIHNRFSMEKILDSQIEAARQNASIFGLVYIDLDDFKLVNDQYGHRIGDLYLQEVTRRMKHQLRAHDLLARLGGDEFAAMVSMAHSRASLEEIAQRLERCFDAPFAIEGKMIRGAASFGMALYPEDGATRESLLSAADAAMYAVKHRKRKRVSLSPDREHHRPFRVPRDHSE
jgi:diguanylate cyclase (GGDEF)-like protein